MTQPIDEARSHRRSRAALALVAVAIVVVCGGLLWRLLWREGTPAPPDYGGRPVLRVLFIGNSLTSANDLPTLVEKVSLAAKSGPVIDATGRATSGAHLGDHLAWGADAAIRQGGWDFVVLQQGPSSLPESREQLLEAVRAYDPLIRGVGAQPALYMVWPTESRSASFDRTCESYRLAALEIDAILCPAGEAWRIAWGKDKTLPLYGTDRFHPSPTGTYLAALVIYTALTGTSTTDIPGPQELGLYAPLTAQQLQALKEAAAESLKPGTVVP